MNQEPLQPEIYDANYYQKYNHGYAEYSTNLGLMNDIKKHIKHLDLKDKLCLDIGCGRGELLKYIIENGGETVGIDYSEAAIKLSKETLDIVKSNFPIKKSKALKMDAKKLEFPINTFDYVFMIDIVEHLHDWELNESINEVYRVLKKDGTLIVHTCPNKTYLNLARNVAKIFGVKFKSDDYHVNEQTYFKMRKLLNQKFKGRLYIIKDKHYWTNQCVFRGNLIKFTSKFVDGILDNMLVELLITKTPLIYILGTDIWFIGTKKSNNKN